MIDGVSYRTMTRPRWVAPVPFGSVSIMAPIGSRRSERGKHARDKEKEKSTEGEVRDKDAEGTVRSHTGVP